MVLWSFTRSIFKKNGWAVTRSGQITKRFFEATYMANGIGSEVLWDIFLVGDYNQYPCDEDYVKGYQIDI